MGALVGLGVGVGLLMIWSAFFVSPRRRPAKKRGRTADLLARAGLGEVSITGFVILCAVAGAVTAFVVQVVSRTPPVALAFGLIGGYLPVAVVSGRARRRQRELAEVCPKPSTTSHPPSARACRCRTRSVRWESADPRRCDRRSTRSRWTTR
jgi:tight adherence protein B